MIESKEIKEVVERLDSNIESLKECDEITIDNIREVLIDLIGIIKNIWEQFGDVYQLVSKIQEIEEATEKGEKYEEEIDEDKTNDIKGIYI